MSPRLFLFPLGGAVGLMASAATAASAPVSPSELSARIDQVGAKAAVQELDGRNQFEAVLGQIGSGNVAWIALAPRLVPAVDGADAEGLGIVLAKALPVSPAAVLGIVTPGDGVIGIDRECSVPFIETTRAENAAYEKRSLAALRRVRDAALISKRDQCRAALVVP